MTSQDIVRFSLPPKPVSDATVRILLEMLIRLKVAHFFVRELGRAEPAVDVHFRSSDASEERVYYSDLAKPSTPDQALPTTDHYDTLYRMAEQMCLNSILQMMVKKIPKDSWPERMAAEVDRIYRKEVLES